MLTWIRNILHNLLCWLYQPLGENMTLTNPSNRADFVGHGATATYPFTFRVDDTDTLTGSRPTPLGHRPTLPTRSPESGMMPEVPSPSPLVI